MKVTVGEAIPSSFVKIYPMLLHQIDSFFKVSVTFHQIYAF